MTMMACDPCTIAPIAAGGIALLFLMMLVVLFVSRPTGAQLFVIRVIVAIAGACFAAVIPGILNIATSNEWLALRAGGALAVFVLLYLFTPRIKM